MAGAPEVEPMPGYLQLFSTACSTFLDAYRDCKDCGVKLSMQTLLDHAFIMPTEIVLFFLCVVMWTSLRWGLTSYLFVPFAQWCRLHSKDVAKMPESAWKLVFYTMSWSYSTYLLFFCDYGFFQNPSSVFYNWKSGMQVPTNIAIYYLIQGSFYGHSIYATMYMDAWRKDSGVMLLHHFITLALITFSYAFRYHNIGLVVLFLHDLDDVLLEFTKLNVYFKIRGGKIYMINDHLSSVGFLAFGITWFIFRLYWFPLKVLYASYITSLKSVPNIPFYFFFNTLLFALLLMNIYWFLFIVQMVMKVLTGQMTGINDVREYEENEVQESVEDEKHESGNGRSAEGGEGGFKAKPPSVERSDTETIATYFPGAARLLGHASNWN
ncbi:ceramide synthase 1 [Silurus asotus]|uniref:Ceramide synthase 1 n=1 Tax=Silurus asotus TaxID=30991 RepID=A0AAD5A4U8_SILAS|nr:ceramide synthase 1 [Silurus asotus]